MPIDTQILVGGAIVAALVGIGFFLNVQQGWLKRENAVNSPMSITLKTEKTPADVYLDARNAWLKRHFAYFVLAVGAWLFFRVNFYEQTTSVEAALSDLISTVLRGLAGILTALANALG